MKKFISVFVLLLLVLVGCQDVKNGTLDTSKLKKVESEGVSDEQKKNIPISYEAPTVKAGLNALPFKIKLPEKLPFDATPFRPPIIDDYAHDGKKLTAVFNAFSKNENKRIAIMIVVFNEAKKIDNPVLEQIKLKDGVNAVYTDQSLHFNKDGISYKINYMNKDISTEQHKKEIIEIANQML